MESAQSSADIASSGTEIASKLSMLVDPQVFLDTRILLRITDYAMWIAAGVIIGLVIRSVIRVVRGHSRPTGRATAIILSIILAATYVAVWHHFGMIPTLEPLLWATSHAFALAASLFWILRRWDRPPAEYVHQADQQPLMIESDDVQEIERRRTELAARLTESLERGDTPRSASARLRVDKSNDRINGRTIDRTTSETTDESGALPWLEDQANGQQQRSPKRRSRAPSAGAPRKQQSATDGAAGTTQKRQSPPAAGGRTAQIPPRRTQRRQNVFETANPLGPRTAPKPAQANIAQPSASRPSVPPTAARPERPAAVTPDSRSRSVDPAGTRPAVNAVNNSRSALKSRPRVDEVMATPATDAGPAGQSRRQNNQRNDSVSGADAARNKHRATGHDKSESTKSTTQEQHNHRRDSNGTARPGVQAPAGLQHPVNASSAAVNGATRDARTHQSSEEISLKPTTPAARPTVGEPARRVNGQATAATDPAEKADNQAVRKEAPVEKPSNGRTALSHPTPTQPVGVLESPPLTLSKNPPSDSSLRSDPNNGKNNFLNPTRASADPVVRQEETQAPAPVTRQEAAAEVQTTADVAPISSISPAVAATSSAGGVRTINIESTKQKTARPDQQQQQPQPQQPPQQSDPDDIGDLGDETTDYFYELSWSELQSGNVHPALWAKAYANADGEDAKARAWYIRYRVSQLEAQRTKKAVTARNRQTTLHAVGKPGVADDSKRRANDDRKVSNQEKISVARAVKPVDDGTETLNCKCCNHALISSEISPTGIATVACNSCGQYSDVYTVDHEPILVKAHPHLTQSGSCIFCSDIGDTDAKLSDGSEYHESCYERMLLEFDELVEDHGADHRATSTYRAALHRVYDHWPDFPPDWAIRRQGKIIDKPQCNFCEGRNNLELAHKTSLQRGGSNLPNNLELICRPCLDNRQANLSRNATRADRPVGA